MKGNSNFLFFIDYFIMSIVDFFVFKCAVYLVTFSNLDKMEFECSSWFQLLAFAIA